MIMSKNPMIQGFQSHTVRTRLFLLVLIIIIRIDDLEQKQRIIDDNFTYCSPKIKVFPECSVKEGMLCVSEKFFLT